MKQFIIFAAMLCSLTADAQTAATFREFLSGFAELRQENITMEMFGIKGDEPFRSKKVDRSEYGFLPEPCDCMAEDGTETTWVKGSKTKRGDIFVTFASMVCEDRWHEEMDAFVNKVITTYTADGRMIDSKTIGRTGGFQRVNYILEVSGKTKDLRITAAQGTLKDSLQALEYGNLDYRMEKRVYTVNGKGQINETSIGAYGQTVARDTDCMKKESFEDFRRLFKPWNGSAITEKIFSSSERQMAQSFVNTFIPRTVDCGCYPRYTHWQPGYYVEKESFTAFYLLKFCDRTKPGAHGNVGFYSDYVVMTFDRKGHLIDTQTLFTSCDTEDFELASSSTPTQFTINKKVIKIVDGENTETSSTPHEIIIDDNGHFIDRITGETKTTKEN